MAVTGFDPSELSAEERAEAKRGLEALLMPMPVGKIVQEITKLAAVMKSRDKAADDLQAMLAIYAADLINFSGYGILTACTIIRRRDVFFPALSELIGEIEKAEHNYRMALNGLTNPTLTATPKTRGITAEDRAHMARLNQLIIDCRWYPDRKAAALQELDALGYAFNGLKAVRKDAA